MADRDQRRANREYYRRNRSRELARVRARQDATRDRLRVLRERPCADCGETFRAHQMDFDHRDPTEKSFRLSSSRAMLASEVDLHREIEKCDIVCANCHRVRTVRAERLRSGSSSTKRTKETERWRARRRAQGWMLAQLRDRPCVDCRKTFLPFVMEFDHRDPATKRSTVTRMLGRAGLDGILAEVAKCDIVCVNCHRERTYRRRMAATPGRE